MTHPCLVVLTARGTSRLIADGGSQAWRLKPENVNRLEYCVCVQNRHNGHWGGADHDHHTAFMVGRVERVVPSPERPDRYLVKFSEYAAIHYPDAWPGLRNPVRYSSLAEFGITDPAALEWNLMPTPALTATPALTPTGGMPSADAVPDEHEGFGPLTIPEARAGLALGLGVPEAAIEIIVRY